jgi:hypothetical protein
LSASTFKTSVALRPEQIEQLAGLLNVSVEHLFGRDSGRTRGKGPAGKLRQVFEKASQLSPSSSARSSNSTPTVTPDF